MTAAVEYAARMYKEEGQRVSVPEAAAQSRHGWMAIEHKPGHLKLTSAGIFGASSNRQEPLYLPDSMDDRPSLLLPSLLRLQRSLPVSICLRQTATPSHRWHTNYRLAAS